MIDDGDAVAHLICLGHVVRRQENGPTGLFRLEGAHAIAHIACGRDVEANGWLIEKEDPWVVQERSRKVQLLSLAC